jgi:hypothetical protein
VRLAGERELVRVLMPRVVGREIEGLPAEDDAALLLGRCGAGTSHTESRKKEMIIRLSVIASVIVAVAVVASAVAAAQKGPVTGESTLAAVGIVDQATLKGRLDSMIRMQAEAARSLDSSRFADFFVDEPSVPLTTKQQDVVAQVAPATAPKGFLTYMQVYWDWWRSGNEYYKKVKAAVEAGRDPDPQDQLRAVPPRTDPIKLPRLVVTTFNVSADRVHLVASGDGATYRVTFVLSGGSWKIAGITEEFKW